MPSPAGGPRRSAPRAPRTVDAATEIARLRANGRQSIVVGVALLIGVVGVIVLSVLVSAGFIIIGIGALSGGGTLVAQGLMSFRRARAIGNPELVGGAVYGTPAFEAWIEARTEARDRRYHRIAALVVGVPALALAVTAAIFGTETVYHVVGILGVPAALGAMWAMWPPRS